MSKCIVWMEREGGWGIEVFDCSLYVGVSKYLFLLLAFFFFSLKYSLVVSG